MGLFPPFQTETLEKGPKLHMLRHLVSYFIWRKQYVAYNGATIDESRTEDLENGQFCKTLD